MQLQVGEKKRKVAGSEVKQAFKTWTNLNPALNHIHNRKVEISKERKDNGVALGNSVSSPERYNESLKAL